MQNGKRIFEKRKHSVINISAYLAVIRVFLHHLGDLRNHFHDFFINGQIVSIISLKKQFYSKLEFKSKKSVIFYPKHNSSLI